MKITKTALEDLVVIEPTCFQDARGFLLETYQEARYQLAGISERFVQDNQSRSSKGVLRGLHFQVRRPQAQLVTVIRGRVYDVAIDLRTASPTFRQWFGIELSDEGPRQLFMGPGFAHGFCVLSDWADMHYKVSQPYDPSDEGGLRWNDPDINIHWPVDAPQVTARDGAYPTLRELTADRLPHSAPRYE